MINEYKQNKVGSKEQPSFTSDNVAVYGDISGGSVSDILTNFIVPATANAYLGLQVYLSPSPQIDEALDKLRAAISVKYKMAVTIGYGPRYLHSTGQLHKGDAGRGLFIQLTGENASDLDIPDVLGKPESSLTFGELKAAQAAGDRQALVDKGRRIIRIHWRRDAARGLKMLAADLLTVVNALP